MQILIPSITHSVDGIVLFGLVFKVVDIASIPLILSIIGNILTISNDTSMDEFWMCLVFNSSIISSRCDVSRIFVSISLASGAQICSRYLARFSIAVLQPVVYNRTGISGLWVLYRVELLLGPALLLMI